MPQLLPPIIIHENVTGFGTGALQEVFRDVYVVCGSNACSSLMGYPIRRKRQMCILVLKRWIYPQLRAAGMSTSRSPVDVQHLVNLQATLDALSARPCHLSWKDFIVATPEEQHAEIREAARRPGVVRRWASAAEGHTTTTDKTGKTCRVFAGDRGCPVLEALLPMERERIESVLWQEHPGADVIDVSPKPKQASQDHQAGRDYLHDRHCRLRLLRADRHHAGTPSCHNARRRRRRLVHERVPDFGRAS